MPAIGTEHSGLGLPVYKVQGQKKPKVHLKRDVIIFSIFALASIIITFLFGFSEINRLKRDVEELKQALELLKETNIKHIVIDQNYNLVSHLFDSSPLEDDYDDGSNGFEYEEENQSEIPFDSYDFPTQEMEYVDPTLLPKDSSLLPSEKTEDAKERNIRAKRTVLAETIDGVEINAEPYSEIKQKNKTLKLHSPISSPITQPGYHSPAWLSHTTANPTLKHYEEISTPLSNPSSPILTRKSRVMHLEDKTKAFKQVIKKPMLKSLEQKNAQEQTAGPAMTAPKNNWHKHQRHRQRLIETLDETQMTILRPNKRTIAAHFNGDTSKYVLGQHTNFNGNGHMRHPDKTYVDWKASDWVKNLNMDQFFQMNEGVLHVKEAGIYLVYAQIYYLDAHDMNGYRVYRNGETILQCTTMTHSKERIMKGNTCYTAAVEYLMDGDKVSIRDLSEGRYSLFENGKSFIGMIKLGDVRNK